MYRADLNIVVFSIQKHTHTHCDLYVVITYSRIDLHDVLCYPF